MSRRARERFRIDRGLFSVSGAVVLADFNAARELAHGINSLRSSERAITAGELNAMALLHEIMHLLVIRYRETTGPVVFGNSLERLEKRFGRTSVEALLVAFVDEFPPRAVYEGELSAAEYLAGATAGEPHREIVLEELLLLWLANANPASAPLVELFDDSRLRHGTVYLECIDELRRIFADSPRVAESNRSLFDELEAPLAAAPDSLQGQLAFIRGAWGHLLGGELDRLLAGLDLLAEEHRPVFPPGPGPVAAPSYAGLDREYEAYSHDLDWMPRLVMLAKNAYVWLDQLSKRHGRAITTLDEIPDEELDSLAGWGISGLWLIGVWERSRASERIKRMMGDEEAVASAYSLLDYRIADDLGGGAAFDTLKERAGERGIRMATDMVPNHVGIDSRWVIEHPDWFIGLDQPPFPSYSFTGADLCDDDRVGIYLEDHYWDRSDAAVVFKRVDHWTGGERYIYHGNDGTSMPWNDTAQLDYRNPEVREAVIQTILHVARMSPIIRFDAAMTLAKKHYHRLWFPEPGSGGDIPSRAGFGMTRQQLDEAMPNEFWREVVDRVAVEAPDTLLLAEAFWLLEGYFVRTLGMHRVYNSAFMNMLRDEKNDEYRRLIKSTLEFDPQILKRYVNFMSNPDERTAVDQFGTGDKYFGVATMMATLPGLPMFGHGQVEGLAEKYGMEFRRPRWDEHPDQDLVRRHERQLFPLLHRRRLFADVENFLLYDFYLANGAVDENVFAYSNRHGDDRSLVLYHNSYADTRGWIRTSAAVADGSGVTQRGLGDGLGIDSEPGRYLIFRDAVTGLEYLRPCDELHREGLYAELAAYQLHVFVDIREVVDDDESQYGDLHGHLEGRGVPSIDDALAELELAPVLDPFRRLLGDDALVRIADPGPKARGRTDRERPLEGIWSEMSALMEAAFEVTGRPVDPGATATAVCDEVTKIRDLLGAPGTIAGLPAGLVGGDSAAGSVLLAWVVARRLDTKMLDDGSAAIAGSLFDELHFSNVLRRALVELGMGTRDAVTAVAGVRLALASGGWYECDGAPRPHLRRFVENVLDEERLSDDLGVNRYEGVLWFRGEAFDNLLAWMRLIAVVETIGDSEAMAEAQRLLEIVAEAKEASGFQVEKLLAALDPDGVEG
jgi:glycosidase